MNPLPALSSSREQTVHETTAEIVELRSRQVSSPGQTSRTVTALCIADNICPLLLLATLIRQTECVVRHGSKGLLSTPHTLGISSQGTDIISEVSNSLFKGIALLLYDTHSGKHSFRDHCYTACPNSSGGAISAAEGTLFCRFVSSSFGDQSVDGTLPKMNLVT